MSENYGKTNGILVIIHGGAGPRDTCPKGILQANKALYAIAKDTREMLLNDDSLEDAAAFCLKCLEKDPQFNAGIGGALQRDGIARLSASIMVGSKQSFSGVVSVPYVDHPSQLALKLQQRSSKVLASPGAELLARELSIPVNSNFPQVRSMKWLKKMQAEDHTSNDFDCDTVGCVIRDANGKLVAASSTGGRGNEYPGRVSDSATVSGNYASQYAAITVTGHGEQINDDAVAARIETRIRDGLLLEVACKKTFAEAQKRKRRYGWIAVDRNGNWGVVHTTNYMPYVVLNETKKIDEFKI